MLHFVVEYIERRAISQRFHPQKTFQIALKYIFFSSITSQVLYVLATLYLNQAFKLLKNDEHFIFLFHENTLVILVKPSMNKMKYLLLPLSGCGHSVCINSRAFFVLQAIPSGNDCL